MTTININNLSAQVEWKQIKNIHLTIYPPDAHIHVSAPMAMTEDAVRLFLISKMGWIKQRTEEVLNQQRQTKREYVSGENHYFMGQRYRLKIVFCDAAPRVELDGKQFIVLYIRESASEQRKEEVLKEWYRKELKVLLSPLVEKWENIIGVSANRWEVKQMKTLWGSCNNSTRNILFNLELAKKPLHCIEYIVAHELLHINVRLHNVAFTAKLDEYLPQWRMLKEELNEFIV